MNQNLICCICHTPYVEPATARTCTHTFCRQCILRALSHSPHCPIDRSPLSINDLTPAGHALRSLVNELSVGCSNKSEGCEHRCERQLLDNHLRNSCPFTLVPCPSSQCQERLFRKDVKALGNSECIHVNVECDGCSALVQRSTLSMHLQECPRQDMNCPDCHTPLRRSELSEHSMICPDYIVKCHHASSGCAWTGARSSSSGHSLSCPYEAIGAFLTQHEDHVSVLTMENASLKHRVASLEGIVESFRSEMRVVKELLGPWTRSRAQARPSDPFSNLNNNVNEPILPRIQTGSTAFPGEPGSFESDFPDYLSPVGAHPPNQDLLASYFPPENNAPSGQPTPDYRHRSSQWLPGQGYTQSPRSMPHRLSASITSPVEPSAFMYPPESRHLSAPRLPQAPHIPPVHLHGTLEDSFDDLRESVVNLAATVTSLSQNTEMALASESLRLGEETVSLRSSVHGLRMQVHGIMVDRHAQASSASDPGAAEYGWLGPTGVRPSRLPGGATSLHGMHASMSPTTKL